MNKKSEVTMKKEEVIEGQVVTDEETKPVALARIAKSDLALPDAVALWKLGDSFFKSGMFPNIANPYAAMAVVELGRELGLPPMMALNTINVIEGRPAMSGQAMLALIEANGVTVDIVEKTKKRCVLTFSRPGKKPLTETFTIEDAASIRGKDGKPLTEKTNYMNYPEEMCFWRCLAKGGRVYCPGVMLGMYAKEEMDGAIQEIAPDPPTKKPSPAKAPVKVAEPVTEPPVQEQEVKDKPEPDTEPAKEPELPKRAKAKPAAEPATKLMDPAEKATDAQIEEIMALVEKFKEAAKQTDEAVADAIKDRIKKVHKVEIASLSDLTEEMGATILRSLAHWIEIFSRPKEAK